MMCKLNTIGTVSWPLLVCFYLLEVIFPILSDYAVVVLPACMDLVHIKFVNTNPRLINSFKICVNHHAKQLSRILSEGKLNGHCILGASDY